MSKIQTIIDQSQFNYLRIQALNILIWFYKEEDLDTLFLVLTEQEIEIINEIYHQYKKSKLSKKDLEYKRNNLLLKI